MKLSSLALLCFVLLTRLENIATQQDENANLLRAKLSEQSNEIDATTPGNLQNYIQNPDQQITTIKNDLQNVNNQEIVNTDTNANKFTPATQVMPNMPDTYSADVKPGDQSVVINPQPEEQLDANALKRERERYEATILSNPKPKESIELELQTKELMKPSKVRNEDEKLEQFVKQNAHEIIKDLSPSERHIEMDESEKDPDDPLKAVLRNAHIQKMVPVDTNLNKHKEDTGNNNNNNNNSNDNLTSLTREGNAVKEYSNLGDTNTLVSQHHHIEPDTTADQLALTEEEHLTKKLDFLKNKLKERKKLYKLKEEERLHDESKQFFNENKGSEDYSSTGAHSKLILEHVRPENNKVDVLDIAKDIGDQILPRLTLRNITDIGRTRGPVLMQHAPPFTFSYDENSRYGPPSWRILNPEWTCTARKQSPINIETQYLMDNDVVKNIVIKVQPQNSPLIGVLRNNGHAPTFSLAPDVTVKLFGGTLQNDYYLKQLHFHFGCDSSMGSEHHINGVIYPLELHLVFWDNSTFATFPEAAKADRGIAVVAVLYQFDNEPPQEDSKSTPLSQFAKMIRNIEEEGDNKTIKEEVNFRLETLLPNIMSPDSMDRFYTYEGSLTTPGCYESVTWVVMATHPPVTKYQMHAFRSLKSTKVNSFGGMCNNFRPVQKKNGRRISSNIL